MRKDVYEKMVFYVYISVMMLLVLSGIGIFLKGVVGAMCEVDLTWFEYMVFGGIMFGVGVVGLVAMLE